MEPAGPRADPGEAARRLAQLVLAGLLPCMLVAVGSTRFVLNVFFKEMPYMLDAGWYSAIIHRSGVIPVNPPIACSYATTYYGVHVSPLISVFSVLSYAVPLDRFDWYAVFQGLVFVPLGLATYLVTMGAPARSSLPRLPASMLAGAGFVLGAQVLVCLTYPHYEAAIAGAICVVLASIATGRRRLMWTFFVLGLATREDAGLHTGLALLPLGLWHARFPGLVVKRRTLLAMAASAFAASVVAMAVQKLGFHAANLLRIEYLGTPTLGHVTPHLVAERVRFLLDQRLFLLVPFLFTVVLAAATRDGAYLLGFLSAAPWFFVNLLAHQEEKSRFDGYTGFPFLASAFWVLVYGVFWARKRRLPVAVMEAAFGAACALSTIVANRTFSVPGIFDQMAFTERATRPSIRAFARALRAQPPILGRLVVDDAVGALAIETLRLEQNYFWRRLAPDTFAFDQRDGLAVQMLPDLAARGLSRCTHVLGTTYSACSGTALPPGFFGETPVEQVPPLLLFSTRFPDGRPRSPAGAVVGSGFPVGIVYDGVFTGIVGPHEVFWRLAPEGNVTGETRELVKVEVLVNQVVREERVLSTEDVRQGREVALPFTSVAADVVIFRFWLVAPGSFRIDDAELRRAAAD
jgi:hypothetical protein